MKKPTIEIYKNDILYPKVVRAVAQILKTTDEISPVTILLQMDHLKRKTYSAWQSGQVPYLERVFMGNLSKASRILRIIEFYAHDLNMVPKQHFYRVKGKHIPLRFSKTGNPNLEKAYARHFKWNRSPEKKLALIEQSLDRIPHLNP